MLEVESCRLAPQVAACAEAGLLLSTMFSVIAPLCVLELICLLSPLILEVGVWCCLWCCWPSHLPGCAPVSPVVPSCNFPGLFVLHWCARSGG